MENDLKEKNKKEDGDQEISLVLKSLIEDEEIIRLGEKKKRNLRVIITMLVIIIILLLFWYLNLPNSGSVRNVCNLANEEEEVGIKEYSCDRFSFKYPGIYSIKTEDTDFDNAERLVNFRTSDKLKKRMVVKISRENVKMIQDVPSVLIRKREMVNKYCESDIEVDGRKGIFFQRSTKDNEKTMFFYSGNILITVSLYSDFNISNENDLMLVRDSFRWKEIN